MIVKSILHVTVLNGQITANEILQAVCKMKNNMITIPTQSTLKSM